MLKKARKLARKYLSPAFSVFFSLYLVVSPLLTLYASPVIAQDGTISDNSEIVQTPETPVDVPTTNPVQVPEVPVPAPVVEEEVQPEVANSSLELPNLMTQNKKDDGGQILVSGASIVAVTEPQTIIGKCVEDAAKEKLQCTANDVAISTVTNINILDDGCKYPGDTVKFEATWNVGTNASERYDIGLYFATQGQSNAKNGTCSVSTLPNSPAPWLNLDNDSCGDIKSSQNLSPKIQVEVTCLDNNGDNQLEIPYCASWDNNSGGSCSGPVEAIPGTGSKCNCPKGGITVPITVPYSASIEVVKDLVPSTDSGRFNLLVDDAKQASCIADNGTTGKVTIGAGTSANPGATHTIGESIDGCGTTLSDYSVAVSCVNRGKTTFHNGPALTTLSVPVVKNDDIVCTITNSKNVGSVKVNKLLDIDGNGTFETANPSTYTWSLDGLGSNVMGTTVPKVLIGSHNVNETMQSGYHFVGWYYTQDSSKSCANPNGTTLPIKVDVFNNQVTDITLCNAADPGHLVVQKTTYPANDSTVFNIEATGGILGTVSDANDYTYNVSVGKYSVNEIVPSGWIQTGNTCKDILVGAGETKTCLITNTKLGSILGLKLNDADGNSETTNDRTPVSGWNIELWKFVSGSEYLKVDTAITNIHGAYEFTNLEPGTYQVREVMISGWIQIAGLTLDVTLEPGEDDGGNNFINVKYATITVNKNVDENGDGDLDDSVDILNATSWTWKMDNGADQASGTTIESVMPGTYVISEVQKPNYHVVNLNCNGVDYGAVESQSILVSSGEDITCTFTNARNLGTLIVKKVVINDNGGIKSASDFEFSINGGDAIAFGADGQNEFIKYAGLKYSIVEKSVDGYQPTYNNCSDVVVPFGGTEICTITNNDIPAQLTVIKHVINDSDGISVAGDFVINVTGSNVSNPSFNGTELPGVTVSLNPGEYNVTEEVTEGYEVSYEGDCSGEIYNGQSKTCIVINNDIDFFPTIDVEKVANVTSVPETGQNVVFTYEVENTSKEPVTITSLNDDVYGVLIGDDDCKVGTVLGINSSCTFSITKFVSGDHSGMDHTNIFEAYLEDNEMNSASDTDYEVITFTDVPPTIEVNKSVNNFVIPETGADVVFTFKIKNTSKEFVSITSLVDDIYGVLVGDEDCKVGTKLAAGTSCDFAITKWVEGDYSGPNHKNTFTATVIDNDGSEVQDSDDAIVDFSNIFPIIEVEKTSNPTSVPETGANVEFTFEVKNTSGKESVTITSLEDTIYGTLDGNDDCKVGTVLAAGENCNFTMTKWVEGNYSGPSHENVFTAHAEDDDKTDTYDSDGAEVDFKNVLPTIVVVKTANITSIPETGANVEFTFEVKNTSSEESVTITSLIDDVYGVLTGDDDCKVGTVLAAGASCDFTMTRWVEGEYGQNHRNIFTAVAVDDDESEATGSDDAVVNFDDVFPDITVIKIADPITIPETGGNVTFTFEVKNNSLEDVTITNLTDSVYGELEGDDNCNIGTILYAGGSCYFSEEFSIPAGIAPAEHVNIFTATVMDNEENKDSDSDDAVVTLTYVPSLRLVKKVVNDFNGSAEPKDWTLYASSDEDYFSDSGNSDSYHFIIPGFAYTLGEYGPSGYAQGAWVCDGGQLEGDKIVLRAEDDVTCTITNTALPGTVIIKKDVLNSEGIGEGVYSEDSFDVIFDEDMENVQSISDAKEKSQEAKFTMLDAGIHSFREISVDGYSFEGCYPEYQEERSSFRIMDEYDSSSPTFYLENGETKTFICRNQALVSDLQLVKSNNTMGADMLPGNTVLYTLKVTAPVLEEGGYVLRNAKVVDLTPKGFNYVGGTWTAMSSVRGDLKALLVTTEPTYGTGSLGTWMLGDMVEGEVVTLTYIAEISELQDPGLYKDLAWTEGQDVLGASVIGEAPMGRFAGTEVNVVAPIEEGEAEVLGVAISLPSTGASAIISILALISSVMGVLLLVFGSLKKRKVSALPIAAFFLSLFIFAGGTSGVFADSDLVVRVEQPSALVNNADVKVGFVALDIQGRDVVAQCSKKSPSDSTFVDFGSPIDLGLGGNSGECKLNNTILNSQGTYEVKVTIVAGSDESSQTVSFSFDSTGPELLNSYTKTKEGCNYVLSFKTANDGQTSKVQIFRSTQKSFVADASTMVKELTVTPNQSVVYTDTPPTCDVEYYYALRALDNANNASDFTADSFSVITYTPAVVTPTTPSADNSGDLNGNGAKDGTGDSTGEVKGTDNAGDNSNTTDNSQNNGTTDSKSKINPIWYWVLGISLGGAAVWTVIKTGILKRILGR